MPVPLSSVDVSEAAAVPTGVEEFDRVLSGGLVPGSVTLLGGEPGIGKSTLLLQVLAARAAAGHRVLLVSAEESAHQVRLRAERLGPVPPGLLILSATDVGQVINAVVESEPDLVVIDSIQAVAVGPATPGERRATGVPGSIGQVRECADQLVGLAKARQVATVLVGPRHQGRLAGRARGPSSTWSTPCSASRATGTTPSACSWPSSTGSDPPGELGLFEMGDQGLNRVDDPGRLLLGDRLTGVPGGVVLPALQGRRTLMVELQALVAPMGQAQPKRSVVGPRRRPPGDDPGRAGPPRRAARCTPSTSSPRWPAGSGSPSRPPTWPWPWPWRRRPPGSPCPPTWPRWARSAWPARCARSPTCRDGSRRRPGSGFGRVVVPASAPGGPPGVELIRVDTVAEAVGRFGCLDAPGG